MALKSTGREILFSACNWGQKDPWSWMRSAGAHMYRSTGDIFDNPESYRQIALSQAAHLNASAPGCFNDIDMLTVGMYGKGLVGTTGCGDAFMAGLAWAYCRGLDLSGSAKAGMAAASLAMESAETINPDINEQALIRRMEAWRQEK